MAANFGFVIFVLWLSLAVSKTTYAPTQYEEGPAQLLCAPEKLLPGGGGAQCAILLWRTNPHLRPSYYRGRSLVPTHYWLLLLAGDIEVNPGPVRYPCTVCSKAVRKNQRGICCDRCESWSHARCCQIDVGEYERLGKSNEEWFCPSCIAAELPFVDESFLSTP